MTNRYDNLTSSSHRLLRRFVIRPGLFVATIVLVVLSLPLMALAALVDLVMRRWRFGTVRIVVFAAWYLLTAVLIQILGFGIWLIAPMGRNPDSAKTQKRNLALINLWIASILRGLRAIVRLRIEVDNPELAHGGAVVAARHQSLADVYMPTSLAANQGSSLRVVLAAGLRREPSLDLFGSRTPQYFLARQSSDMESELAHIRDLAVGLDDDTALVIFPEGGLFRDERKAKVVAALDKRDPEQAKRARALNHLLPAKVAGFSALLDGAPEADVVIVGHVGFEQLTDPATIWRSIPLDRPIRTTINRYERVAIPDDLTGRKMWLNDRWDEMDQWVSHNLNGAQHDRKGSE